MSFLVAKSPPVATSPPNMMYPESVTNGSLKSTQASLYQEREFESLIEVVAVADSNSRLGTAAAAAARVPHREYSSS